MNSEYHITYKWSTENNEIKQLNLSKENCLMKLLSQEIGLLSQDNELINLWTSDKWPKYD